MPRKVTFLQHFKLFFIPGLEKRASFLPQNEKSEESFSFQTGKAKNFPKDRMPTPRSTKNGYDRRDFQAFGYVNVRKEHRYVRKREAL